jgi:uncharacterized phage protein (predicted DNA packaging)
MKILTLEEALEWLVDIPEEDYPLVQRLIKTAESYLKNATGKEFTSDNELAKLFCLTLITDWYENRQLTGEKIGEKVRFIIQSMLTQLQYGGDEE